MQTLAPVDARTLVERMRERRILVVGDLMVDEWIWGQVSRISPEAPVPVVAVTDHSYTLGGAGNVALNLRVLGARVDIAAVVGDDSFADRAEQMLEEHEIGAAGLLRASDRPTTRKTRIVAHNQQVVRADWESAESLANVHTEALASKIAELAKDADAVVLSDYAKGVFSRSIVEASLASRVVVADPKPQNLSLFSGVTCVAPNVHEAAAASGIAIKDDESLERAGRSLLERLDCRYVIVTRGEHGMSLFSAGASPVHIPSVARTVFDVSGAGDTVVAVLSLSLAAGAPVQLAMQLANFAAGAVVEKLGTATASADEIIALVDHASG